MDLGFRVLAAFFFLFFLEKRGKMEWAATLNEYEKLVIRMNTPRSVLLFFF